jgi:tripartite-type tricarboxylate transporter receptor subunit TctC
MTSHRIGFALIVLLAALVAPVVHAQDYPNRPVTLLVPQAPAASSDVIARTIQEPLQAAWRQRS